MPPLREAPLARRPPVWSGWSRLRAESLGLAWVLGHERPGPVLMSPEGQHARSEDASHEARTLRVQCQPRHASLIQCSIVSTLSFIGHCNALRPATLFSSQPVNVNDATQLEINPGVTVADSIAINNGRKKFGLRKESFRAGKEYAKRPRFAPNDWRKPRRFAYI